MSKTYNSSFSPDYWMELAVEQANQAGTQGEVPIGAVLVKDDQLISAGHNLVEKLKDASAHAEIVAIRAAGKTESSAIDSWRLNGCTLFVTLEPCPMCISALILARVDRIYFGAKDPRLGACGSIFDLSNHPGLPHKIQVFSGVLEEQCTTLLQEFFAQARLKQS